MINIKLYNIKDCPQLAEKVAQWFAQKWEIPIIEYKQSIVKCIENKSIIPQWYIVLNEQQEIIAGAGVIENDFHDRKDLTPNICALYVEENYRKNGIAGYILDFICQDLRSKGIKKLYLVTEHEGFYEKYGWSFLTVVNDDVGGILRMYGIDCGGILNGDFNYGR